MNTIGTMFRFTSFGESHGPGIGGVVDGCPAGLKLNLEAIQKQLDRRRPGQSGLTTQRKETDRFQILSGLLDNTTFGSPIAFFIPNEDAKPSDYNHLEQVFRPSHADFTYFSKYGIRDHRGGGRSSARVTAGWVLAGAIARQFLQSKLAFEVQAWVESVGNIHLDSGFTVRNGFEEVGDAAVQHTRCPDLLTAAKMAAAIENARMEGDTLGGIIRCRISGLPVGLGEPLFGKAHAVLSQALFSINAVKGVEFGMGFEGSTKRGSEMNDRFSAESGEIFPITNNSGGIQGGITNGAPVEFRVAFKPTSTLMKTQETVDAAGNPVLLEGKGRHDPCVVPRAVPIVEAMASLVFADLFLLAGK